MENQYLYILPSNKALSVLCGLAGSIAALVCPLVFHFAILPIMVKPAMEVVIHNGPSLFQVEVMMGLLCGASAGIGMFLITILFRKSKKKHMEGLGCMVMEIDDTPFR